MTIDFDIFFFYIIIFIFILIPESGLYFRLSISALFFFEAQAP